MEQKQLDDVGESFSEEFIDDADFAEEIIVENNKEPIIKSMAEKPKRKARKTARKEAEKAAEEEKVEHTTTQEDMEQDILIEPATKDPDRTAAVSEPEEPAGVYDPWKDEREDEVGPSKKGPGMWKALAVIALILLIASVYTQGFNFDSGADVTGAATASLSLQEAEQRVISFVNTNLLQPPFAATVVSSAEAADLYRITLSVAGQEVDSYLTKDGSLFFPQGFATDEALLAPGTAEEAAPDAEGPGAEEDPLVSDVSTDESAVSAGEVPVADTVDNNITSDTTPDTNDTAAAEESAAQPAVEEEEEEMRTEFSIVAKRWLFSPNKVTVPAGKTITFTIEPQSLEFTFAIPSLNVSEEVSGTTVISFNPKNLGTYDFLCSSCEGPQAGMAGTLIVK